MHEAVTVARRAFFGRNRWLFWRKSHGILDGGEETSSNTAPGYRRGRATYWRAETSGSARQVWFFLTEFYADPLSTSFCRLSGLP